MFPLAQKALYRAVIVAPLSLLPVGFHDLSNRGGEAETRRPLLPLDEEPWTYVTGPPTDQVRGPIAVSTDRSFRGFQAPEQARLPAPWLS